VARAAAAADGWPPAEAAAPGEAPTPAPAAPAAPKPVAKPVGGFKLGFIAIWALIKNFFRKLFGGGKNKTSA
jgi:hypothetical protein